MIFRPREMVVSPGCLNMSEICAHEGDDEWEVEGEGWGGESFPPPAAPARARSTPLSGIRPSRFRVPVPFRRPATHLLVQPDAQRREDELPLQRGPEALVQGRGPLLPRNLAHDGDHSGALAGPRGGSGVLGLLQQLQADLGRVDGERGDLRKDKEMGVRAQGRTNSLGYARDPRGLTSAAQAAVPAAAKVAHQGRSAAISAVGPQAIERGAQE
jgi:hypothetical protein